MISTKEALDLILQQTQLLPEETLDLAKSVGFVLATDVLAEIDAPGFDQTAMDGYALSLKDWKKGWVEAEVSGTIQAGDIKEYNCDRAQIYRIFTGAPLPKGADVVVVQEVVEVLSNGKIRFNTEKLVPGMNIRPKASHVAKGSVLLPKGTYIDAACVGLLASQGIKNMHVISRPKVGILSTGSELVPVGTDLRFGQVYESNSIMLSSALKQLGITAVLVRHVLDDIYALQKTIQEFLSQVDVILITGGVSVGDYDYVKRALEENDVQQVFHKIKQKPGKPFYFGVKDDKMVFGLPGNPASTLTCFSMYVLPALRKMVGITQFRNTALALPLAHDFVKKSGLTYWLKASAKDNSVTILDAQESYKLTAYTKANCIVSLPEHAEKLLAGTLVETFYFDELMRFYPDYKIFDMYS